ncbi:MAG: lysoplasmalogenase [Burkholderiales bacterium]
MNPPKETSRLHRALPLLAALSGVAAILSFVGGLPAVLAFVFKPLTTLLVIGYAWPRGATAPKQRRLVRIGLILSLAGDVFLLWPKDGFLPGLVAFLLAHLAYIAAFCVPVRLAAKPLVFVAYALVAAAILSALWPGVPAALRAPVVAYVVCLAAMAAQAFVWWRSSATAHATDATLARAAAFGGALFMVSDSLLAINKFAAPLPLASLWILLTYWLAQWCIASALHPLEQAREAA